MNISKSNSTSLNLYPFIDDTNFKSIIVRFIERRIDMCRNSSVGRALDWRSKGPWFDPEFRHLFFVNFNSVDLKIISSKLRIHNLTYQNETRLYILYIDFCFLLLYWPSRLWSNNPRFEATSDTGLIIKPDGRTKYGVL